jgi:hypothetical protein
MHETESSMLCLVSAITADLLSQKRDRVADSPVNDLKDTKAVRLAHSCKLSG